MRPSEWFATAFLVALILLIGAIVGGTIGSCNAKLDTNRAWQTDAMKRGLGEFIITDSTTGATKFQWRAPQPKGKEG